MTDYISRADAIDAVRGLSVLVDDKDFSYFEDALNALPSAEPIERISNNTIVVKYADYEDIGRIILTNGDIFCKMFYEDARQNDDSDYDSLVPDEYKTEPSDLISREKAIESMELESAKEGAYGYIDIKSAVETLEELPSADAVQGEWKFVDHEIFAGEYFCSICGKRAEVDLYGEWILSNYCGHCGARMKGGAE